MAEVHFLTIEVLYIASMKIVNAPLLSLKEAFRKTTPILFLRQGDYKWINYGRSIRG